MNAVVGKIGAEGLFLGGERRYFMDYGGGIEWLIIHNSIKNFLDILIYYYNS